MNEGSLFEVSLAVVELPFVGWAITNNDTPTQYNHILLEDSESALLFEDGGQILIE